MTGVLRNLVNCAVVVLFSMSAAAAAPSASAAGPRHADAAVRASAAPSVSAVSSAGPAPSAGPIVSTGPTATLTVDNEPLANVFRAVASRLRLPITVSQAAARYRLSGRFDLSKPMEMIENVSRDLGLLWYFDGRVVYLYDGKEVRTILFALPPGMLDELQRFLKRTALYDPKYPFGSSEDQRAIYLSGPPKYIEIVSAAVQLLRNKAAETRIVAKARDVAGRRLELIRLRHASVGERSFDVRGTRVAVPGIAAVLQEALNGKIDVVASPGTSAAGALPPGANPAAASLAVPSAAASNFPTPALSLPAASPGAALGGKGGESNRSSAADSVAAMVGQAAAAAGAALGMPNAAAAPPPLPPLPSNPGAAASRDASAAPPRVIPYADANSLLVDGTPSQIDEIKRIIALLDQPKKQIELSLWVIDIRKDDGRQLGVQLGGRIGAGRLFDFSLDFGPAAINKEQTARFLTKISALSNQQRAQIVSRPILLTQDNVPAIFDNNHTYYAQIKGYRANSLEAITYGTMINVLPRIASDVGQIEMTLAIEDGNTKNGASGGEKGADSLPLVSRTQINTVARVMHEESLLVGGYTLDDNGDDANKVPFLGDIPVLGNLFKYKNSRRNSYVRMFLIQPKVLDENASFKGADTFNSDSIIDNAVDALRRRLEERRVQ